MLARLFLPNSINIQISLIQEGRDEDRLAGEDRGAEDDGERGAHQDLRRAHRQSGISLNKEKIAQICQFVLLT